MASGRPLGLLEHAKLLSGHAKRRAAAASRPKLTQMSIAFQDVRKGVRRHCDRVAYEAERAESSKVCMCLDRPARLRLAVSFMSNEAD
jgi:hypothetical protein